MTTSKQLPLVACTACGTTLSATATECAACGASILSRVQKRPSIGKFLPRAVVRLFVGGVVWLVLAVLAVSSANSHSEQEWRFFLLALAGTVCIPLWVIWPIGKYIYLSVRKAKTNERQAANLPFTATKRDHKYAPYEKNQSVLIDPKFRLSDPNLPAIHKRPSQRGADSTKPVISFMANVFRSIVSLLLLIGALIFAVYGARIFPSASVLWLLAAFCLCAVSVLVLTKRNRRTLILGLVVSTIPIGVVWIAVIFISAAAFSR